MNELVWNPPPFSGGEVITLKWERSLSEVHLLGSTGCLPGPIVLDCRSTLQQQQQQWWLKGAAFQNGLCSTYNLLNWLGADESIDIQASNCQD